jgi:hypothetical protein
MQVITYTTQYLDPYNLLRSYLSPRAREELRMSHFLIIHLSAGCISYAFLTERERSALRRSILRNPPSQRDPLQSILSRTWTDSFTAQKAHIRRDIPWAVVPS